ncbi:MAG: TauD/TfdA family dioxygenase [Cytophagales bacterium]|nr:TauD/TfdA family dioxygenase [Cytophagales bacterium]
MNELIDLHVMAREQTFPLLTTPEGKQDLGLGGFLKKNEARIQDDLKKHGAILFRGFGLESVEDFNKAAGALGDLIEYKERSSPRHSVAGRIYTSTDYPADQEINMHNENSYSRSWPLKVIFFCLTPSTEGGETPIMDSRKVLSMLSEATRLKFQEKGVKYVRNLGNSLGLDWREVFQTDNKAEVEEYCTLRSIRYEWLSNDRLRLNYTTPAIRKHPVTGEAVWFNHAFFFNIHSLDAEFVEEILLVMEKEDFAFLSYYGDGSEIEKEVIEEIRAIYHRAATRFTWQKGDFLLLDNMLVAHGRASFKGERKVLVAMMEPQSYKDYE